MVLDLGLGLYFLIISFNQKPGCCNAVLSLFVSVFFALSLLIGFCLTCTKSCSEPPIRPGLRGQTTCDDYRECCCSLYAVLNETWVPSSATDIENFSSINQTISNIISDQTDTVASGETMAQPIKT